MDKVTITAPPATTAISQTGRPLLPTSWNSFSPSLKNDGCSVVGVTVVVPSLGVVTGTVIPPCFFSVVFLVGLLLESVV